MMTFFPSPMSKPLNILLTSSMNRVMMKHNHLNHAVIRRRSNDERLFWNGLWRAFFCRNDLQDLFSEIQNRMKRRTLNQKRKMESELKSTISRTVDEMSKKIEAIKTEVYQKEELFFLK